MTTSTPTLSTGTWSIDPVHSDVSFKVRHMGVGKVRGTFGVTSGELVVGEDGLAGAKATAVLDTTSFSTNNDTRDVHIKSADFLEADKFPTIEFDSTGIKDLGEDSFTLVGDLTVHGVTKPVELKVEHAGETVDAYGKDRTGFTATTTISRKEYGVDIEMGFGVGNVVVADKIDITLELEYTKNA